MKKKILIFAALCCALFMSACEKNQDNTGNIPNSTTASKTEEKSGENTVIDVFSELNVTFEGENGSGKAVCEYTGNNDFIKYDVEFRIEGNGTLRNGDTAIIKLDYSDYRAESENIFFKEKEKEYTVDGLWGVILDPDGYDFSECNKALEERMFDKERVGSDFIISDLDVGKTFWSSYIDGKQEHASWKIISVEYEPICGKFYIPDYSYDISNDYILYYKATLLCKRIEDDYNIDPETNYAIGSTKEWKFLISEKTHNVFIEQNSNVVKADPKSYTVTTLIDNTPGHADVMSMGKIYGMGLSEEYKDNFDEYFQKINSLLRGEFYDIEIK